ncbi:ABC-type thiamine/hydroxymethylpyrimidine transport system permease subunit [Nocardioides zeae]|uniref:ABC-type thiamine/hydroxymethylpyrimidine transport system permease subunit n=2 Tax=Nocardioides zeae TaxID=1457234 RepID=A0AAJ1U7H4_9ACTN|nr:hypothetical protein [Nocardioides zeae]MDQ1105572.1 ABC-type thiamine/hydroxymethylpyrimidine transport system permease subunit [Nocardioides zeae]MDR6174747.1 ABC-type thiamine/hydroxymethylpyrimidine transport system permease subunit [Nocardioides zeae]MDR6210816.1 ABC-type thiamine/hydroxymethylpyrimidine transport system permease subunit [Nocardioides zeae]
MSQTAPVPNNNSGFRVMSIIGIVLGFVALLFVPIIVGPVGAVLGFVAYAKGDRLGLWAGIWCIAATIIGMVLGYLVVSNM